MDAGFLWGPLQLPGRTHETLVQTDRRSAPRPSRVTVRSASAPLGPDLGFVGYSLNGVQSAADDWRAPPRAMRCQATAASRVIAARQAKTPSGANVAIMRASSIESTRHPSAKLAWISFSVTRLGPNSPGWRSLKQSRKRRPPGAMAARRLST